MENSGQSLVLLAIFMLVSIPVSVFDIRTRKIPNWIVFSGMVFLFAVRFLYFKDSPVSMFINILIGGLIFYSVRFITKGKLGMGDVKFAAFIALFSGFPIFFAAVGFASLSGLIFAVAGMAMGKIKKNTKIPFAPFLTAGSIVIYILKIIYL